MTHTTDSTAQPRSAEATSSKKAGAPEQTPMKSLIASTTGQLLEWFEWSAYAVFAPFIAAVMFDKNNPTAGLLATFGVLAIGFFARPVGGIVFGIIGDRKGRKFVLMTTILMMAAASVVIGVLPGHESIGIWAAVILMLIRLIQGFAHGGESAAANAYIPEIAPRKHRALWGSFVYVSIFGGSVIAYTLGGVISLFLSDEQIGAWGWRIPFWLSAAAALVALYMRRGMIESEAFVEHSAGEGSPAAPAHAAVQGPADEVASSSVNRKAAPVWVSILLVIGMVSGVTATHYVWTSYVSTYAIKGQGMSTSGAYWVTVFAQLVGLIALPLWGMLSDRIGRKPVIYIFAGGLIILEIPLMGLISAAPWTLLVASTLAIIFVAAGGALLSPIMAEVFPTAHRTKAIGLAYSISVAVFGGTAPYIFQLVSNLNVGWLSGVYIVVLCALTMISMKLLPETKGIDLKSV